METKDEGYTTRLQRLQKARLFDRQVLYRRHLERLNLGRVLDLGCGIGRNLANLARSRSAVGVDHNPHSVAVARARGFSAFVPDDFEASPHAQPGGFDSLLLAHVLEHLDLDSGSSLLGRFLRYVKPGGRVVVITPQEAGFDSDPTHVLFADFAVSASILASNGVAVTKQYSFPLPRAFGRLFRYNEFITIGRVAEAADAGSASGSGGAGASSLPNDGENHRRQ